MQGIEVWGTTEERIRGFWTSFGFRLLKYNCWCMQKKSPSWDPASYETSLSLLCLLLIYISWELYGLICPVAHKEPIPPLCTLYSTFNMIHFILQWCTLQLYSDVRYSFIVMYVTVEATWSTTIFSTEMKAWMREPDEWRTMYVLFSVASSST